MANANDHTPPAGTKYRMVNPTTDNKFEMRYLQGQTEEDARAEMMAIIRMEDIKQAYLELYGEERITFTFP